MSIPLKSRNHVNFSAANKCHFLFKAIILDYSCKQSESLYHGLFTVHNKTKPFHDGGRYHIETSPLSKLISGANQWTGFYIITASVMKGSKIKACIVCSFIIQLLDSVLYHSMEACLTYWSIFLLTLNKPD